MIDLHLRFFVVKIMDPKWWSSIKLLICGVTSSPSQPIMKSWPMALFSKLADLMLQYGANALPV